LTTALTAPQSVPTEDPLLLHDGAVWIASAQASGPFTGLQGGAVGAILAAEIERAAPDDVRPLSIRVEFLRRVPVERALVVKVGAIHSVRRARRVSL
jgi:hypothetical protein